MNIFDIVLDWVVNPLISFFSRRSTSGQWHFVHLSPVATALGCGIWWLGSHWEIALLSLIGILIFLVFGLISLATLIPRWKGEHEDFYYWHMQKKRAAEASESDTSQEA